jgi:hypothetical protein
MLVMSIAQNCWTLPIVFDREAARSSSQKRASRFCRAMTPVAALVQADHRVAAATARSGNSVVTPTRAARVALGQ